MDCADYMAIDSSLQETVVALGASLTVSILIILALSIALYLFYKRLVSSVQTDLADAGFVNVSSLYNICLAFKQNMLSMLSICCEIIYMIRIILLWISI